MLLPRLLTNALPLVRRSPPPASDVHAHTFTHTHAHTAKKERGSLEHGSESERLALVRFECVPPPTAAASVHCKHRATSKSVTEMQLRLWHASAARPGALRGRGRRRSPLAMSETGCPPSATISSPASEAQLSGPSAEWELAKRHNEGERRMAHMETGAHSQAQKCKQHASARARRHTQTHCFPDTTWKVSVSCAQGGITADTAHIISTHRAGDPQHNSKYDAQPSCAEDGPWS